MNTATSSFSIANGPSKLIDVVLLSFAFSNFLASAVLFFVLQIMISVSFSSWLRLVTNSYLSPDSPIHGSTAIHIIADKMLFFVNLISCFV